MVRLTLVTCAAVYAVLLVWSERAADDVVQIGTTPTQAAPAVIASTPSALVSADGRRLAVVLAIEPRRLVETSGQIALVQTPRGAQTIPTAIAPPPASEPAPLGEVTGTAVNLRAGPSAREPVLASLIRGDRVEVIGATDTGWALIRAVSTGVEGFMSARFLTPLN
jgi:hypothetical protein